ncbi:YeeE/YedE family protein [Maricaulaceae bacterium EIL42A08]|nr:YeeE/YedE family protein [Maricaulaceae bacterium EIL42A08]
MDYATEFTPISAAIGGGLIGVATLWLMAANGRIAGISGIAGSLIGPDGGDRLWRLAFIVGLVVAPLGYMATGREIDVNIPASTPILVIAGLLVGLGTQLGSGCTSGHGVCGISRFSVRGIVATITFMVTGAIAVYLIRHVL